MFWLKFLLFLTLYLASQTFAVQMAAKLLFEFKPRFQNVYILIFVSTIASASFDWLIKLATSSNSQFKQEDVFTPLAISLLVEVFLFAKYIKHSETGAIGAGKALKLVILAAILGALITISLSIILLKVFNLLR